MNLLLTGQEETHLTPLAGSDALLHPDAVEPFIALQKDAAAAGFELAIASSFRSFSRQCAIWNAKAAGQRPVFDDAGNEVDVDSLDEWQAALAILRWSALPGASRHHWGTDMDVFDRRSLPAGYRLQLTLAETRPGGVMAGFHQWLDKWIADGRAHGFYRPYGVDRGGVGCEPWHLSYRPVAAQLEANLTPAVLREVLQHSDIALRDTVLNHLEEIVERFVRVS